MEDNRSQYSSGQRFQYSNQQQFQYHSQQKQASQSSSEDYFCGKCGARVPRFNRFCEECGEPVDSNVCPHCNGKLSGHIEICPYCGKPVDTTRCSFCGGVIEAGDNFCCDCGNPVDGLRCPVCGTVNFRNFCRKCNAPLTESAQVQLFRVKNDPRVRRAQRLAVELEELEQKIKALQKETIEKETIEGDGVFQKPQSILSDEDQRILQTYSELFGKGVFSPKSAKMTPGTQNKLASHSQTQAGQPQNNNQNLSTGNNSPAAAEGVNPQLEQLKEQYQHKVKEMSVALLDLVPDPQDPPIVQRDFLCACKVMTTEHILVKKKERIAWICNLCGCRHNQPSECARPELGGKWIYSDTIVSGEAQKESQIFL